MGEYTATVRVLVNDAAIEGPWLAEHGMAFWVHVTAGALQYRLLFDAGQTPQVLAHNARALKTDWAALDSVVISHGHADHTGGLLEALRSCGRRIPVLLHPDALLPKLKTAPVLREIGIPHRQAHLEDAAFLLVTRESLPLTSLMRPVARSLAKTRSNDLRNSRRCGMGAWSGTTSVTTRRSLSTSRTRASWSSRDAPMRGS